MAYVTGIGSYGGVNQYKDRIFVGDDGNNVFPVAGQYYASMMEHAPGAIAGVSFIDGVVERVGSKGLDRLWVDESNLPTPSEVDAPGLWLARLDLETGN